MYSAFPDFQSFFVIIILYLKASLPYDFDNVLCKCLQSERALNGIHRKQYMLKNPALRARH